MITYKELYMLQRLYLVFLSAFILFTSDSCYSDCKGKIDPGVIFVRVKVQESGQTIKTLDMGGARIDGTIILAEGYGICLKPFFQAASGDGDLLSGGIGLGHYTPITKRFCILPVVGFNAGHLQTRIDLPIAPGIVLEDQKERFHSKGFYIGLEASYKISPNFIVSGIWQYNWSRTHTRIGSVVNQTSFCQGSNYAITADYYFCDNWSVNAAAAINNSLSKEKHGIVAYGGKLGVGYLF